MSIEFEKPHIDPVTLKPRFREHITWSASPQAIGATREEARDFALTLLEVCHHVDWLKMGFTAYADDDEKLLGIVEKYQ